ncbi:hypothetical protein Scep_023780 [Stephania cephalantha]|uniref:MULE transposase domain-containing protein n=1 Tax=Stephania cephalantha TaxID=152367 RepID=A0AAP0HXT7_9MAGN
MMAREIQSVVKTDQGVTIKTLIEIIKKKYGHEVNYKLMWDAKKKAIEWVFGDWDESYAQLPRWLAAVRSKSPGTRIEWSHRQWHDDEISTASPQFRRVFFAFEASIQAFKFCRPLLQIDATFLYGRYSGKLMIALSVDENGHILPVAFAVAETESTDSWGWFLRMLRKHVTDREGICVISDRHPDILEAVNIPINGFCPPKGYHRYCLRHLLSNFGTQFKNVVPLKVLLGRAAVQHQERKFIACMERFTYLSSRTPQCLQYVNAIPKELWTQSHDGGMRYGWMNSNGVECFNGVLKGARFLPITALTQMIYYRLVTYHDQRNQEINAAISKGQVYTEYVMKKLAKYEKICKEVSRHVDQSRHW